MAIDDPVDDKDKDKEEEGEGKTPKKKGKLLKIIVIVVSVLVLLGGTVGGTMYFTGAFTHDEGNAAAESTDTADTANNEGDAASKDKKGKKGSKKKAKSVPNYYAFDPAFIVNFVENNQIRYLQITMEIMTRDETVIEDIKTHMPVIRNNLVLVFSNQTYDTLSTAAGKQKMRDEALAEIQQILKNETGKAGVEAVYFTSFVMQ